MACTAERFGFATWNLYLGADILPVVATDVSDRFERVQTFVAQLDATCFEQRATAVATGLSDRRPDVVGLQEVVRFTEIAAGRVRLVRDHLPVLLAALRAAGAAYLVAGSAETYQAEYPLSPDTRLGFANHDVVLLLEEAVHSGRVRLLGSGGSPVTAPGPRGDTVTTCAPRRRCSTDWTTCWPTPTCSQCR